MGVAGSGKTTLAQEVIRRISAVYLDNNHIVDAFFPKTRNGSKYEGLRDGFYKALYTIAEENLKLGNSVLLDVPHIKEVQDSRWRTFVSAIAARTNAKLIVIRCVCSEEALRTRIKLRDEPRDQWKLSHWKAFLSQQPIDVAIPFPHLDVNTEMNLSRNTTIAVRYIREQLNGR